MLGPKSVVAACDVSLHLSLPVAFALREYSKLSEIVRFPVAQIDFLEFVIDPIHELAMDTRVLFAMHNFPRGQLHM